MRKRVILPVGYSWLSEVVKNGKYEVYGSKIPNTAKFISASYEPREDRFLLLYEDDSFPQTEEGQRYPIAESPVFKRIYK